MNRSMIHAFWFALPIGNPGVFAAAPKDDVMMMLQLSKGQAWPALLTSEGTHMVSHAAMVRSGRSSVAMLLQQQAGILQGGCDYPTDVTVLWWPVGIFEDRPEANISGCEVKCVEPASTQACGER